jgi:hypothetical protein
VYRILPSWLQLHEFANKIKMGNTYKWTFRRKAKGGRPRIRQELE